MGTAVILVVVVVLLFVALTYNGLVARRNRCESAFSTIDVMLKKRYDLIPNLVETVQGYATHERETFEELARLRGEAAAGRLSTEQSVALNNRITGLLGNVMAVVENYPQLKASDNFLHLQRSLNEIEEQIAAARRAFNAAVMDLNNAVQMFPGSIIANLFHVAPRSFLDAPQEERAAPDVGPRLSPEQQEQAMSAPRSFEQYYEKEMLPVLEALEERRRRRGRVLQGGRGGRRHRGAGVLVAAGAARAPLAALIGIVLGDWWPLIGGPPGASPALASEAKRQVIGALARFVDPSLTYDPEDSISEEPVQAERHLHPGHRPLQAARTWSAARSAPRRSPSRRSTPSTAPRTRTARAAPARAPRPSSGACSSWPTSTRSCAAARWCCRTWRSAFSATWARACRAWQRSSSAATW